MASGGGELGRCVLHGGDVGTGGVGGTSVRVDFRHIRNGRGDLDFGDGRGCGSSSRSDLDRGGLDMWGLDRRCLNRLGRSLDGLSHGNVLHGRRRGRGRLLLNLLGLLWLGLDGRLLLHRSRLDRRGGWSRRGLRGKGGDVAGQREGGPVRAALFDPVIDLFGMAVRGRGAEFETVGMRAGLRRSPSLDHLPLPGFDAAAEELQEGGIDEQDAAIGVAFERRVGPSPELGGENVVRRPIHNTSRGGLRESRKAPSRVCFDLYRLNGVLLGLEKHDLGGQS